MRSTIFLGVAILWLCTPSLAFCQLQYVGEVIVVGNTFTPDDVIRRQLQDLLPGQFLRFSDVASQSTN